METQHPPLSGTFCRLRSESLSTFVSELYRNRKSDNRDDDQRQLALLRELVTQAKLPGGRTITFTVVERGTGLHTEAFQGDLNWLHLAVNEELNLGLKGTWGCAVMPGDSHWSLKDEFGERGHLLSPQQELRRLQHYRGLQAANEALIEMPLRLKILAQELSGKADIRVAITMAEPLAEEAQVEPAEALANV